ncbi:uncharacterized protein KY384_000362 [Bacidia gigantensis]|uniref:uncharacterized protein n=1 Tax=Bacidia gigantensis TaxID=2732470 RepID=UPI001D03982E|nr:uncharacterized protein KY384_000362 [Bacidia gigantensis]KAG8526369.1 hypothetical protein KY384_000362 [Bacidia gigantensis]
MSTANFRCEKHVVPCQHIRGYPRSLAGKQEEVLHLEIKQYTPLDNLSPQPGDVTIIGAHSSAFPKELYEPLWDDLLQVSKQGNGLRIRNIWFADVAHQGASGIMNEDKTGNDPSWFDHARDLLLMVNHFRDQMLRPIVGIGHSMGGNQMINLALLHPRLLTTVIAIEPTINRSAKEMQNTFNTFYGLALKKDIWESREKAIAEAGRNPLFKRWDERAFRLWGKHALRDLPTSLYDGKIETGTRPVTLTTTKHNEIFTFARAAYPPDKRPLTELKPTGLSHPDLGSGDARNYTNAFYRPESPLTFMQLPYLRPTCLYIHGSNSLMAGAKPQGRADKLEVTGTGIGGSGGVAAGAVADVIVEKCGHFLTFEKPAEIAVHVGRWLTQELKRWREDEQRTQDLWERTDSRSKRTIDDDRLFWMKRQFEARKRPNPDVNKGLSQPTSKL